MFTIVTRNENQSLRLNAKEIYLFSPAVNNQNEENVISSVAILISDGEIYYLMHAIQDNDFYEPFSTRYSFIIYQNISNPMEQSLDLIRKTGVISSDPNWHKVDLKEKNVLVDISQMLSSFRDSRSVIMDDSVAYLFQEMDTIHIRFPWEIGLR